MKLPLHTSILSTTLCALLLTFTSWARGAVLVLHQQTFGSDPGASYTMLAGGPGFVFDIAGFNSGVGNTVQDIENGVLASGGSSPSGAGSWEGSFNAIGTPAPATGTLRITDPNFLAEYDTTYPGYVSYFLGFAFYASVIPADFLITIGNGSLTYVMNLLPQVTSTGWNDVYVYFNSGWLGSGSSISDPLNGMTYIDLSWSRNGSSAQQFYFDDFTLFGDDAGGGGGGGSAIPEPRLGLFVLGAMLMFGARRVRLAALRAAE